MISFSKGCDTLHRSNDVYRMTFSPIQPKKNTHKVTKRAIKISTTDKLSINIEHRTNATQALKTVSKMKNKKNNFCG